MWDRSVKNVVILFANPKSETTPMFNFCIYPATGYSQRDVSPALFRARVAGSSEQMGAGISIISES